MHSFSLGLYCYLVSYLFKLNTYVPVLSFSNNRIFLFGFILFYKVARQRGPQEANALKTVSGIIF